MEVRLTLQELAEIGSHGFPRVSCYGHRGEQVDNGRKWPKMVEKWSKKVHRGYLVENGFSRVSRHSPTTSNKGGLSKTKGLSSQTSTSNTNMQPTQQSSQVREVISSFSIDSTHYHFYSLDIELIAINPKENNE